MKRLALASVLSAALISVNVFAQQPARLATGVPGPGPRPPFGAPAPPEQGLRSLSSVQGKVVKLTANDDFTFNGFYLLVGNDSLVVKFPAHMGSQIMPVAKTGSLVSVSGVMENPPFANKELRMVTLTSGDKTITETFPGTPPVAVQETGVSGDGKIKSLQTNQEGLVTGIFVDSKTVLRLPPHAGSQLGTSIGKGAAISYTGSQKSKVQGEVQLEDYRIIRCNTLTLNGQQYLVK